MAIEQILFKVYHGNISEEEYQELFLFSLGCIKSQRSNVQLDEIKDIFQKSVADFFSTCRKNGLPENSEAYFRRILINGTTSEFRRIKNKEFTEFVKKIDEQIKLLQIEGKLYSNTDRNIVCAEKEMQNNPTYIKDSDLSSIIFRYIHLFDEKENRWTKPKLESLKNLIEKIVVESKSIILISQLKDLLASNLGYFKNY
ncbi:MAG: hypothetical protein D6707_13030, partial [Bacteroidetes bacterium]